MNKRSDAATAKMVRPDEGEKSAAVE